MFLPGTRIKYARRQEDPPIERHGHRYTGVVLKETHTSFKDAYLVKWDWSDDTRNGASTFDTTFLYNPYFCAICDEEFEGVEDYLCPKCRENVIY